MIKFIEITMANANTKQIIPVDCIDIVEEPGDSDYQVSHTLIVIRGEKVFVNESYDEIRKLLLK
jgi:hypothetical protein